MMFLEMSSICEHNDQCILDGSMLNCSKETKKQYHKQPYEEELSDSLTVPSRSILKKWMSRGTVPIRGLSRQVGLQINFDGAHVSLP